MENDKKLLRRVLDWISDISAIHWFIVLVITMITTIWAYIGELPGYVVFLFALAAFAITIMTLHDIKDYQDKKKNKSKNEESPLIIENEVFPDDITGEFDQLVTYRIRLHNNSPDPITNIEIRIVDIRKEKNNKVPIQFKGRLPYKLKTLPQINQDQRERVDIFSSKNSGKWQYVNIGGKGGIEMFGEYPYILEINVTSDCPGVQVAKLRIGLKYQGPFLEIIDISSN